MKFHTQILEYPGNSVANKRQVFECIAEAAAQTQPELDANTITQMLLQRERLGSTYVGNGIALPHIKVAHLNEACFILVHLKNPIECEGINEKADLFLGLLVPEIEHDEYLPLMDELVNELKTPEGRNKIRHCHCQDELHHFLEELPLCQAAS